MAAMKKLGRYLGLVEDDQDYDYQYAGQAQPQQAARPAEYPAASSGYQAATASPAPVRPTPAPAPREDRHSSRLAPVQQPAAAAAATDPYAIHTIHPRSYNDARRIGEEFRAGAPVIMNLGEMNDADAKRIVDFAAGLVFAMHGSMERVTQKVFLISPANVDVRDAPAVQQARDGFFNQS